VKGGQGGWAEAFEVRDAARSSNVDPYNQAHKSDAEKLANRRHSLRESTFMCTRFGSDDPVWLVDTNDAGYDGRALGRLHET
jgi:hypothetical protein